MYSTKKRLLNGCTMGLPHRIAVSPYSWMGCVASDADGFHQLASVSIERLNFL